MHVRAAQQLLQRGRDRHGLPGNDAGSDRKLADLPHPHVRQPPLFIIDASLGRRNALGVRCEEF